jgi:hypothetical protein
VRPFGGTVRTMISRRVRGASHSSAPSCREYGPSPTACVRDQDPVPTVQQRAAKAWRRHAPLVFSALLIVAAAGCRGDNGALVESQLRARETDVRLLRGELDRAHAVNQGLQTELQTLHGESGECLPGVRPGGSAYPIRSLALGRQTGGHDAGDCAGDSALQVVVEPRDADDQTVKVPAVLTVQALEVTPEGVKRPLSTWEVGEDDLRRTWRSGLLTTGYVVVLPWKMWPATEKLRVVVQMRTSDGRVFEADRDVTVRLAPGAQRSAPLPQLPPPTLIPTPKPVDKEPTGPTLEPAQLLRPSPMWNLK